MTRPSPTLSFRLYEQRQCLLVKRLAALGEGIDDAEVVQARKDQERLRLRWPGFGEQARLALELRAFQGARGDHQRRLDRGGLVEEVEARDGGIVELEVGIEGKPRQAPEIEDAAD